MLRSMFSGLSGLRNHQTALDVVGNNIANVNTVGYKGSRIQFAELLSQTIRGASSPVSGGVGGTNPIQVGLGIGTAAIQVSHQQGNLQSTGNMSDIAIQGNGFFILGDGQKESYTRAGQFSFDASGAMVHANGMNAKGWMADSSGVINTNSTIANVKIPVGTSIPARATTAIDYAHNLDSTSDVTGTPHLAVGNSSNIERAFGTYTGNANALDNLGASFPITADLIGSHYLTINAESQSGTRITLNGTESLASLGVTDTSTFRVAVDGVSSTVTLTNGTSSTVNDVISAINAQINGVTAELKANTVVLTRTTAGLTSNVSVEDTGNLRNGIAANIFGNGTQVWTTGVRNQGSTILGGSAAIAEAKTLVGGPPALGVALGTLIVTVNEAAGAKVLTYTPGALTDLASLITDFNTWGASAGFLKPVKMSVNNAGKLLIESKDPTRAATDLSVADGTGTIKASLMGVTTQVGRSSVLATVTHSFIEADGGGTHYVPMTFGNGDATITGLDGVNISATSSKFKAGTAIIQTVAKAEHTASTLVYDSLGKSHSISVTLSRVANNTWNWTASGIDTSGSGSLTFDPTGMVQSGASSGNITIGASGGADSISITPNFTAVTQYATPSSMLHVQQDGYTDGALSTYSIDTNGKILGIYTNGLNQGIGQLAVAAFNNPAGLLKISDSMFISSDNSGAAQVGPANLGGRGSLSAGTLEMSNVDVAQEFANMIIYERGFQANSKVITTGDDMLQTLVGMKR